MLTTDDLQGYDERTVMVVNAYIKNKGVQITGKIPAEIKQAGLELAKAFTDGKLLQGRTEGIVASKSSRAGDVSVSKTYANGADGQPICAEQMIADALLEPFIVKSVGINAVVSRFQPSTQGKTAPYKAWGGNFGHLYAQDNNASYAQIRQANALLCVVIALLVQARL